MTSIRYARKAFNTAAFAEDCEVGRLTTPAALPIATTGTDRMENRPNTDDLIECAFCARIPEFPCPMCFGWGFYTKSMDEEFRKEVEGLSELDIAGWFCAAQSVAARRDRQNGG
jgi:hypothetical protein